MEIIEPDPSYLPSFLAAWGEFDDSRDGDGDSAGWMGIFEGTDDEWRSPAGFRRHCELRRQERFSPRPGRVPAAMLWAVEDGEWLGRVSVRFELNEYLASVGGHIGYAVRPSARRRGVATALLRAGLAELHARGVDEARVTCDDDNVASSRTIERCGGVLEDVTDGTRRYWVPTD